MMRLMRDPIEREAKEAENANERPVKVIEPTRLSKVSMRCFMESD